MSRATGVRSACTTQFRIDWAEGSNSFASSSGSRPEKAVVDLLDALKGAR
jgi:hypothetical protein